MNDLISVIIPIYNKGQYLVRCLENIMTQSYKNIEILLVDDGSQDNSYEISLEYEKKDNRIKVFHKSNGGPSSARNLGLKNVQGKYVVFVDADDLVDKDYVFELYLAIKENNALMSVCEMRQVNENTNETDWKTDYSSFNTVIKSREEYLELLEMNWAPYCKMFDKSLIENVEYDEKYFIAEDLLFNVQVICDNDNFDIAVSKKCLYTYIMVPNSIMNSSYSEKNLAGLICEEEALQKLYDLEIGNKVCKILFGGVIGFYARYSLLTKQEKKQYEEHYNEVRSIVNRRKKYLLKKNGRASSNRMKMKMIVYIPKLYLFIREKF